MTRILVVDDEKNLRWALEKALKKKGYQVTTAENGQEAWDKLTIGGTDLVILDQKMPVMDGITALEKIKTNFPQLPVIMLTAFGSLENAVEAMRLGAADYLAKPFDLDELKLKVDKALEINSLQKQVDYLQDTVSEQFNGYKLIGESQEIKAIESFISKIADTQASVLIQGETGTGKELVARSIHAQSKRGKKNFVAVNCAALPENLLESELFGHEKGAFTGALAAKAGRFELAHGGTIFLDEIGEVPLNMQVKLLRVLQEREFQRLGGTETIKVDIRVIAATNRNLKEMVVIGDFREDLYYRLNVLPLYLPPLRERKGDIVLLAQYFLAKFTEGNKVQKQFTQEALAALQSYSWPGNIRELENVVERAVIISQSQLVGLDSLGLELEIKREKGNFLLPKEGISLEELEKDLISQALEMTQGNQTKAAALLGISRSTFLYRLQKYNLHDA